jgi:hypothetical protein
MHNANLQPVNGSFMPGSIANGHCHCQCTALLPAITTLFATANVAATTMLLHLPATMLQW